MSLAVVRDRQSNGAKGSLAIPREVNVYITSRRLNERGEKSAITRWRGIIIAECLFVDYRSREYSIESPLGSSSRASRHQYLPTSRYNFESANEEKCRSRVHGANVTRNRKDAYQSRDATSIRIFRLIPPVISLNKHCAGRIHANYFRGTACD